MHVFMLQMCFLCAIFFSLSKGDKSSITKEIEGAWWQGFRDLVTVEWEFWGANLKGIWHLYSPFNTIFNTTTATGAKIGKTRSTRTIAKHVRTVVTETEA